MVEEKNIEELNSELKIGSIVSVVGAGGKTTLINNLAKNYSENHRVLITTTTKIYPPTHYKEIYHNLDFVGELDLKNNKLENGIYVVAPTFKDKLSSLTFEELDILKKHFDYIFIEADGSKRKPLKGWNDTEPVIYPNSDMVVGVLDITQLGKNIDEDIIHRLDIFLDLIDKKKNKENKYIDKRKIKEIEKRNIGNKITTDDYVKIITSPKGIFKNSNYKMKKVIFFTKIDLVRELERKGIIMKGIAHEIIHKCEGEVQ